jgi:2,3-bisphosphoglycerate-dependent phosphoglycerate mutase
MTSITRVVLVRHGESCAQIDGFIAGHRTCAGLSPLGRRQAHALRHRLATTGELGDVDAVYTSVQARAIETADILRPALGDAIPATRDCAWCELHPGIAEGLTWNQLRQQHPVDGDPDDPHRPRVTGAETWVDLYRRISDGLRRLIRDHPGQRIVVVGHGGTVGASLVALGEVPIERGVGVIRNIANASITEWHHAGTTWRLVRFNDAQHVADLEPGPLPAPP